MTEGPQPPSCPPPIHLQRSARNSDDEDDQTWGEWGTPSGTATRDTDEEDHTRRLAILDTQPSSSQDPEASPSANIDGDIGTQGSPRLDIIGTMDFL